MILVAAARQRYSPDHLLAQVSTTGAMIGVRPRLGAAGMILVAAAGRLIAVVAGLVVGRSAESPAAITGGGSRTP